MNEAVTVRIQKIKKNTIKGRLIFFLVLVAILLLITVIADKIVPYDPYVQDLNQSRQAPSAAHWMGTDQYGRDVFSRVVVGAQTSIFSTLALVGVISVFGTIVGTLCGYYGGALDSVVMRISDVCLAFPGLVFALAIAAMLGGGVSNAVIALAVISWPKYARVARSQTLALKNGPFVSAARLSGSTSLQIILRHILPNILGPILVTAMLAYPLSRQDLVGRKFWNLLFVFTMYFGGGLVPYYMVLKGIHMLNTFWVFIFPMMMSVYNMILIRSYIESMPDSLFEAAKIDGANDLVVFVKMVIPLSKPILMTVALFVAINQWNSWFDAYLYTSDQALKPMQSILVEILNQYQTGASTSQAMSNAKAGVTVTPDSIRMAATMVATLPIIMVYPFVQKYFVKGIMLGAVKG